MSEQLSKEQLLDQPKAGIGAFIALAFAICLFSGAMFQIVKSHPDLAWLGAFDFNTLAGKFGSISGTIFRGKGGVGARDGFLFALTLFGPVMTALGILAVLEHYGALRAAQVLLTPLLRPILDIPGYTGLALVTDLQSTDAGAAISKSLYDNGLMTKKELVIMSAWQYCGAGCIGNYFSTVAALFSSFTCAIGLPIIVILVFKFIAGFFVRCGLNLFYSKDFQ